MALSVFFCVHFLRKIILRGHGVRGEVDTDGLPVPVPHPVDIFHNIIRFLRFINPNVFFYCIHFALESAKSPNFTYSLRLMSLWFYEKGIRFYFFKRAKVPSARSRHAN